MKAIRKMIGLLMVLLLAASLAGTAFATGGGSITVENPKSGETYTAYRVFDVVYNEDKSAYSYTIAADSQWLNVVQSYEGVTLSELVTDGDGNSFYIVSQNDDFSAAAFAKLLQAAMEGKPELRWYLQTARLPQPVWIWAIISYPAPMAPSVI